MNEALAIGWFVAGAVWKVLPAFLLSVALGVLIRALALDGFIRRVVEARAGFAVVLGTAVGAFSPLCSCTVIPVISGLLASGVPLAPVMSFWVASPTMEPEMFALTVATLGWPLAVARLLATIVLSLGAGYLTLALTRSGVLSPDVLRPGMLPRPRPAATRLPALSLPVLQPALIGGGREAVLDRPIAGGSSPVPAGSACCGTGSVRGATSDGRAFPPSGSWAIVERLRTIRWSTFGRDMAAGTWRLGRWLVLAFVLEAVMLRHVPQAAIAAVLGEGSRYAVLLAALVGIPLYLNNVSALPIVSGLLAQGMQPGAAVAFLIAGPVTTVPAMSAVWGIVKPRIFALYIGAALAGALVFGWLTNLLLG